MDGELETWLEELGLARYITTLRAQDVDFRALAHLDDDDLKTLGLSLGHRRILLAAIAEREASRAARHVSARRQVSAEDEAERRLLTVMFCDLVGSTALSRAVDPEDLREIMRSYQNAVVGAVVRYEGYVAKFLGDGVLAYFGWPRAHEDQAERAVRAALDAIVAVRSIKLDGERTLDGRVGIASGEVVVGDLVGDALSDDHAVTGATPNLAARFQAFARTGQIVIGPMTRQLLATTFELENLGSHPLKGYPDPVPLWRVIREADTESRFEAVRGRTYTQLVGRGSELALLRERWQQAKQGQGQVVILVGEAGIGKSRIVQEFREQIGDDPRFGFRYQCSPHHSDSALYPVIQRFQRVAGFADRDSEDAKLKKLERWLEPIVEDVPRVAPLFAEMMGLHGEERYGTVALTAQQRRQQTIDALIAQVLTVGRRQTVLFVVEDAHWADPSMLDYICELIPNIAGHAVLLVVTERPFEPAPWPKLDHLSTLQLERLTFDQASEIAQAVGGHALSEEMLVQLARRADGVPLYVEELTKAVLDVGPGGREAGSEMVPASLQSSLVARLDRLNDAKEMAQIGSVIGREFSFDLLAAIAAREESDIEIALGRLVASGLVHQQGTPPYARYSFKHALVQDAAYATMLTSRRRRLHGAIVAALEAGAHGGAAARTDVLAFHAFQAELWDKAFNYMSEAAYALVGRFSLKEAVSRFQQALVAAEHLQQTRELSKRTLDLRFELRNVLWALGRFGEILTYLADAEALAKAIDDPVRMGWVSVFRSASLWQIGRSEEALEAADKAIAIAEQGSDSCLEVAGKFYLGCARVTGAHLREAERVFGDVCDTLTGDRVFERCGLPFAPSIVSRSWLVWSLAERGCFAEAKIHGDEAARLAEELEQPFNLAHIHYDMGYFWAAKGDFPQAIATLEQAYGLIRDWNLTYLSPFTMGFLGHSYAMAGRLAEGRSLLQQALARYEAIGLGLFRALVGVQLAEVQLAAGQAAEAQRTLDASLRFARQRGERGFEVHGLRVQGEVSAHPSISDLGKAETELTTALKQAERLGMRPLASHCRLSLGRLMVRLDRQSEASTLLEDAENAYRNLGMSYWRDKAAQRLLSDPGDR
ncbi:MAG: AAA family ATPase [Geminicoccaceae bacterium]